MARRRVVADPKDRDAYFISKILKDSPFEFKKENGIWYKRVKPKKKQTEWQEIVFSENSAAIDNEGLY